MLRSNNNILPYESGYIHKVPEEIFAEIGCRLILLQNLEYFIEFVVKVAFADNAEIAKKEILREDKKTLGQLLRIMRTRVDIEESFNDILKRTLKARNIFVHEFSMKYDLHSLEGLRQAVGFLTETMDDLEEVSKTMKALAISYGSEEQISDPHLEDFWRKNGDLNELESKYVPSLGEIFEKKNK